MKNELLKYKFLFASILFVLTVILAFLFFYAKNEELASVEKLALEQAKASFNKDLVYRRWSAQNGGVYVLLHDSLKPNPYLKVKEREITSTSGKTYTLINPAYMTRMVHELAKQQYKVKGHITSLNPINPANKADEWEQIALKKFETGDSLFYSVVKTDGENYLRYMGAMITEKSCLKCHSEQGYKEGDIRGGISVSVPLENYELIYQSNVNDHILLFTSIYFIILLLLFIAYKVLSGEVKKRKSLKEIELEYALRHKRIIQSALNGFLIVDNKGNILETNPAYCKMTGYSEEELLKMKVSDLEYIENEEEVKNHIRKVKTEGKDRFESIHKSKDGSMINIEVNTLLEPFENNKIVSFIEDITDRKKNERELKESEQKYRQLFENMNEAFALHKIVKNNNKEVVDYLFVDINPQFEQLTGLKKENIIGKSVLEVLPNTEKYWIERYGKVALTGEPVEFSNYAKELDNYYHVKAYSPEKEYFAVTFSDITNQKKAENKLLESEERFRNIIERAPDAVYVHDFNGNIIATNQMACNDIGYTRDEIVGMNVVDIEAAFISVDDLQKVWKNVEEGKSISMEGTHKRKNRSTFPVEVHISRIYIQEKEHFVAFVLDLTSRIEAQRALKESEKRYRMIIESANDAIFIANSNSGIIIDVNKKGEELIGLERNDIIGMHQSELHPPELTDFVKKSFKEYTKVNEKSTMLETFVQNVGGRKIPVEISSAKVKFDDEKKYLIGFFRDISKRIEAKKALLESEKKYRDLVETSQELIWKCDSKGQYIYLNKAWETTFGYSLEEMIGKSFGEFQTQEDFQRDMSAFTKLLAGGSLRSYETTHFAKDGTKLTLLFNAIHVTDEEGNVIGTQGTATDITELKEHEQELEKHQNHLEQLVKERTDELEASNEELRATNEELYSQRDELELAIKKINETQSQLVQAEKMASLGVLVAGVAHEINNPVNFINSSLVGLKNNLNYLLSFTDLYNQLSEDNLAVIEEIRTKQKEVSLSNVLEMFKRSVEIIEVGIERTTKIVKSLRSFARSDEKRVARFDVHENIDNTLLILYHQYKNHVEIKKEFGKIPLINCFTGQINQVIMNILTNAIQAVEKKGTITITTEKVRDNNISIAIKDNGPGITKENLEHIFDPFFTTKGVGKGTGLGLSISYNIVKDHKGEILVTSEIGKGSCFTIVLPVNFK